MKVEKKKKKTHRKVVSKHKKTQKKYFKEKLSKERDVKDFWDLCKLYFTSKGICKDDKITLAEKY